MSHAEAAAGHPRKFMSGTSAPGEPARSAAGAGARPPRWCSDGHSVDSIALGHPAHREGTGAAHSWSPRVVLMFVQGQTRHGGIPSLPLHVGARSPLHRGRTP